MGRFGVIWERQEIVKTGLSKDSAVNLARQKNEELFPGKPAYYKVVEGRGVNFLVE